MSTIDSVLRRSIEGRGGARVLTLDPRFQGLPQTAHGGSVLAAFDALAGLTGPHAVRGVYRRRVPLGAPLPLTLTRADGRLACMLADAAGTVLVEGAVAPADDEAPGGASTTALADDAHPLPISRACFACGTDNPLGLQVRLAFDTERVGGTWTPRAPFRDPDGTLAVAALTTLLDEAAFWLGALATGESGMTTELTVTLHRRPTWGAAIAVGGARAAVRPRADDPRYWQTEVAAHEATGALVASARIVFVAVRGAARRLCHGMLAINDPAVVRRVFPAYVR